MVGGFSFGAFSLEGGRDLRAHSDDGEWGMRRVRGRGRGKRTLFNIGVLLNLPPLPLLDELTVFVCQTHKLWLHSLLSLCLFLFPLSPLSAPYSVLALAFVCPLPLPDPLTLVLWKLAPEEVGAPPPVQVEAPVREMFEAEPTERIERVSSSLRREGEEGA
jgi:hypothetical protein